MVELDGGLANGSDLAVRAFSLIAVRLLVVDDETRTRVNFRDTIALTEKLISQLEPSGAPGVNQLQTRHTSSGKSRVSGRLARLAR